MSDAIGSGQPGLRRNVKPDRAPLRVTPNHDDVLAVLAAIAAYEEGDAECSNYVIDWETGLKPSTVDLVLHYLWLQDMIECKLCGDSGRHPPVGDTRRVLGSRERCWGPWGRYRSV
jgi:hypothetical protein